MSSRDHRPKDQLDTLIRRALIQSVGDEEPPAHIWDRIRAELRRPKRQATLFWSRPVLQAALLFVILVVSSTLVKPDWLMESSPGSFYPSSKASSTLPVEQSGPLSPAQYRTGRRANNTTPGTENATRDMAFLQGMRSTLIQEPAGQPPEQGVAASTVHDAEDLPDPSSVQAKAILLASSQNTEASSGATEPTDGGLWPNQSIWQ